MTLKLAPLAATATVTVLVKTDGRSYLAAEHTERISIPLTVDAAGDPFDLTVGPDWSELADRLRALADDLDPRAEVPE